MKFETNVGADVTVFQHKKWDVLWQCLSHLDLWSLTYSCRLCTSFVIKCSFLSWSRRVWGCDRSRTSFAGDASNPFQRQVKWSCDIRYTSAALRLADDRYEHTPKKKKKSHKQVQWRSRGFHAKKLSHNNRSRSRGVAECWWQTTEGEPHRNKPGRENGTLFVYKLSRGLNASVKSWSSLARPAH